MVDRDIEEALDLLAVQVHGQDSVASGGHQEICDELRRDGDPRLILPSCWRNRRMAARR